MASSRRPPYPWGLRFAGWLASRRPRSLVIAALLLVPFGTLGYLAFAGLPPLEALFQTLVTLTTVGYEDLAPSTAGRIFTLVLMVVGVSVVAVALSSLAAFLIEGRLRRMIGRRRMEREIQDLRNHVILCGFGRFGQLTAEELQRGDVPFVVVDDDPEQVTHAEERGMMALGADATEEATLTQAGIERAQSVISTLASDAANVYVALTAKAMRADVTVVTLARDPRAESKLRAAGADYVVSPYTIGATSMARRILRPHVTRLVDALRYAPGAEGSVQLEELAVRAGSPLVGQRLRETPLRREFGLTVVAVVKTREGGVHQNPDPDLVLEAGDVLVCVGAPHGLQRAMEECAPPRD